ncbi:MAG: N-acetylneuraminate synthase family protein [Porticoccaceae bacterium]
MKYDFGFDIGSKKIDITQKPYFIADIAANHDGDIERAKDLIYLAKESGADCAKFQHFKADKIVSDEGFSSLQNSKMSHQSTWKKSVAEIYDQYHTKREWNDTLIQTCEAANIEFMTTPYDIEAMEGLINAVNAIKIGSGDITYLPFLRKIAELGKPVLLATGASNIHETIEAVNCLMQKNPQICLMQCNTNYTGDLENFKYVNLNVLKTFSTLYPNLPLGFSDHTPGHAAVLGAITLGARVVEKHFTDDNSRIGPDHHFALNPKTWREMVDRSEELFFSLGDGIKRVERNEIDTVIIQRRSIRVARDINVGEILKLSDLEFLRPCPDDGITPADVSQVIDRLCNTEKKKGDCLRFSDLD